MFTRFLLLAALSLSGLASAHSVMDALKVIDRSKQENWHYRVTENITMKDTNISMTVAIFDPSKEKNQRWSLESTHGRAPTEKERLKYIDKQTNDTDDKFSEQIDEKSLQSLDSGANPKRWSFRMKSDADLGGFDPSKLTGSLTLNEQGDVTSIDLKNTDSFRMKMIVKVNHLNIHLEYAKQTNGENLITSQNIDSDISLMGKEINTKMSKKVDILRYKTAAQN